MKKIILNGETMAKKVERTAPGSKNDYRITYDTGAQKWTDDKPGDGKGNSTGDKFQELLGSPSVQRGLTTISKAVKSGKGLEDAVKALVRDVGTEKGTTILNAVHREFKKTDIPDKELAGWDKARGMVASRVRILDFPRCKQAEEYTCGAVAVQVVLAYYGIKSIESELKKQLDTTEDGTGIGEMGRVFFDYKLKAATYQGITPEFIRKQIGKGFPVILVLQAWAEDEEDLQEDKAGHYVVAIGYGDGKFVFEDPYTIERVWLSEDELMERWEHTDKSGRFLKQCGIVVYGQHEYNSQRAIHMDKTASDFSKATINLNQEYHKFNNKYFDGELPSNLKLKWNKSKRVSGDARATINQITGVITPTTINISTYFKLDEESFTSTLIHEMIHVWNYVHNRNENHGPFFRAKARELSSKAGVKITLTDTSEREVAEDTKLTDYVALVWGDGKLDRLTIFFAGSYKKSRMVLDRWAEERANAAALIGSDFVAEFWLTNSKDLARYKANRTVNRFGYYALPSSVYASIRQSGKKISEFTSAGRGGEFSKVLANGVALEIQKYMEKKFHVPFDVKHTSTGGGSKFDISSLGDGHIFVSWDAVRGYSISIADKSTTLESSRFTEPPEVNDFVFDLNSIEREFGLDGIIELFSGRLSRTADVSRVIKRILKTVRNPDLADEMIDKVQTYDKTHNDKDDMPAQEQRMLYGPEDYGDVKQLTKKRKLDIGWTDHAEYRSELRDVDPKEVNQAIVDKMMKKLNPPQRGNQRFKEPGLGTFVVDYNTQKNPAEADVITVWAKEKNMNASVVKELQAVASALVAAEAMRPVTASEMDVYCSDCARQIEAGEMVVTRGELRELISSGRDQVKQGWRVR